MKNFFGWDFGSPGNIYYFLILIVVALILILQVRKSLNLANILASPVHQKELLINFSKSRKILKSVLFLLSLFFLLFSLLSPQKQDKPEDIKQEGRDIFIALDISRSMLAKDVEPNRLEFAKEKIKQLINMLKTDRVGLILFSGSAFVQCPLTKDIATFYMFLDQANVETVSSGTTSIDMAVKVAIDKFSSMPAKKSKILVLFTDGEDFSSNLAGIKKQAQKENLAIFAVGVGSEQGAPIPLYDEQGNQVGHQLDEKGSVVISRLNEGILKTLANECGGYYVHATSNNSDLKAISSRVEKFEKEVFGSQNLMKFDQKYPYFVCASLACLLLEWLI